MELQILNPLQIGNWDDLVLSTGKASFFHSSSWAKVLHDSYSYKPVYFALMEHDKIAALMPFMEVNSFLTGKRGVSLPFSDYCQPLCSNTIQFQEMVLGVTKYAKRAGWKYIEWRPIQSIFANEAACSRYYVHLLSLEGTPEDIFSSFRESTQRNIRKAIKQGLNIQVLNSLGSINEFYRLHCVTRREHGFPPQPFGFFKSIFDHIITTKKGVVVLASYGQMPVAGGVFFHFGDKAVFKYGASDRKYHHLRPNNLVMWEGIKWCKSKSFKTLNFGRTDLDDTGLMQFKSGWGTERQVALYHRYNLRKKAFVSNHKTWRMASRLARKLPSPIFNLVGSVLYRHVG
jgi:hypothetical protein